jgi:hypothetical protein
MSKPDKFGFLILFMGLYSFGFTAMQPEGSILGLAGSITALAFMIVGSYIVLKGNNEQRH